MEQILKLKQEIIDFLALAKDLNYDVAAMYAKEPEFINISVGIIAVIALILLVLIKKSLNKSTAFNSLSNLDNSENSFEDYQKNLTTVLKVIPKAKPEFLEILDDKKNHFFRAQLELFYNFEIDEKLKNYQAMANMYSKIALASQYHESISQFYEEKAISLLSEDLNSTIDSYMKEFEFNQENVVHLEEIVNYANTQENPELVIELVTKHLNSVDFGDNLEIFILARSLESDKLAQLYDYMQTQLSRLFENANTKVSGDILDYLLENGEKEHVYTYISRLKIATYLQELNYKYFNQNDNLEFDLVFMSNPIEINADYSAYLFNKITKNWKDDTLLETLIANENVANIIGHDEVRKVMERIDAIRDEYDAKAVLAEALESAKNAEKIALEAKELAQELAQTNNTPKEELNVN